MAFYSSGVEYGIHSLMCMVDSKGDARDMSVRKLPNCKVCHMTIWQNFHPSVQSGSGAQH